MALATAAEVRTEAPHLFAESGSDDARLTALIARADAVFARHCNHPRPDTGGHTMEAAAYTVFPGRYAIGVGLDSHRLVLPTPEVISVTSVHVDEQQDYGDATLLDTTEYVATGSMLELTIDASTGWSAAPRANKVVVSAGYDVDDHDTLKMAAILQVIHWARNSATAGERSSSVVQGSSRTVDRLGLLDEVRDLLADYVLMVP